MNTAEKTPLEKVGLISETLGKDMASLGILYVEDLIAYHTALGENPSLLSRALHITDERLASIIDQARKILPPDKLQDLTTQPPKEEMPYGTRDPKELDGNKNE